MKPGRIRFANIAGLIVLILTGLYGALALHGQQAEQDRETTAAQKRWAIICSKDLKKIGLSEFLTNALTSDDGLEMVERDLLETATAEIELANFALAANADKRLQLGKQLGANNLVLISTEVAETVKSIRIVVCDCQYGVRLLDWQIEMGEQNVAELSEICKDPILKTRDRFANGISQIIGIAPLQSKNLTHDFDRYQKGFPYLTQSALLAFPGVAAIEIEEARAIQKELARSAQDRLDRVVMTFLDGSFRFDDSDGRENLVTFNLQMQTAAGEQAIAPKPLALDDALEFLTKTLPQRLLDAGNPGLPGLQEFSQTKWLSQQADAFSLRGDWIESTSLREAAILLEPGHVDLRRQNVADYLSLCTSVCEQREELEQLRFHHPEVKAVAGQRTAAFLAYLAHLEYLIRNRMISANEAVKSTRTSMVFTQPDVRWLMREKTAAIKAAERDFFLKTSPLILELSRDFSIQFSPNQPFEMKEEVLRHLLHDLQFKAFKKPFDRNINLDLIFNVVTELIPDGSPISNELHSFFQRIPASEPKQWDDFLQKLIDSDNKNANLLGQYSRLSSKLPSNSRPPRPGNGEVSQAKPSLENLRKLSQEVEQLLRDYDSLPYCTSDIEQSERKFEPIRKNLEWNRQQLAKVIADQAMAPTTKPEQPTGENTDLARAGRVHETPIKINLLLKQGDPRELVDLSAQLSEKKWERQTWQIRRTADAKNYSRQARLNLTNCGELDVWWNEGAILVMREKGLMEEVILDPDALFSDVCWDGENIWIASRLKGVMILDPDSLEIVHRCGEKQGAPPADKALQIIPIAPGKILAVGAFGKNSRAWCATIRLKNGELVPEVFHEATNVNFGGEDRKRDWSDASTVFWPAWIAKFDPGRGRATQFLVGRAHDSLQGSPNLFFADDHLPLLIDANSKSVRVFDREMAINLNSYGFDNRDTFFSRNGELFRCRRYSVRWFKSPDASKKDDSDLIEKICDLTVGMDFKQAQFADTPRIHKFIKANGQLIVPGIRWIVLNPETMQESLFTNVDSSLLEVRHFYGQSAHYGLIGWNEGYHKESFDFTQYELRPDK